MATLLASTCWRSPSHDKRLAIIENKGNFVRSILGLALLIPRSESVAPRC